MLSGTHRERVAEGGEGGCKRMLFVWISSRHHVAQVVLSRTRVYFISVARGWCIVASPAP